MGESRLHQLLTRAEEALLARTLEGRRLQRPVTTPAGGIVFAAGRTIDRLVLDEARERDLLEELAHAAEPGTSDSELEDWLWWRKKRRDEAAHSSHGHVPE